MILLVLAPLDLENVRFSYVKMGKEGVVKAKIPVPLDRVGTKQKTRAHGCQYGLRMWMTYMLWPRERESKWSFLLRICLGVSESAT